MKIKLKNINSLLLLLFLFSLLLLKILNPSKIEKIQSQEMKNNVGKFVEICGNITKIRNYSEMKLIYAKDRYGKFTGVIFTSGVKNIKNILVGHQYCFCGEIVLYKGHPEIQIKYICK